MTGNPLEKLFCWSPEKIGWYSDACEYSGNDRNEKLSDAILCQLQSRPYICDFGCGIGALSLVLAKSAGRITAVEINSDALNRFQASVSEKGFDNIEIINGDFTQLCPPPQKADCALLCKTGGDCFLRYAKQWTDGKVIIITDVAEKHCFSSKPKMNVKKSSDEIRAHLKKDGYSFSEVSIKTAFGQPLRNYEDAIRFISSYNRSSSRSEIVGILNECLVNTGRGDFPLYLPNAKEYLVFTVSV